MFCGSHVAPQSLTWSLCCSYRKIDRSLMYLGIVSFLFWQSGLKGRHLVSSPMLLIWDTKPMSSNSTWRGQLSSCIWGYLEEWYEHKACYRPLIKSSYLLGERRRGKDNAHIQKGKRQVTQHSLTWTCFVLHKAGWVRLLRWWGFHS